MDTVDIDAAGLTIIMLLCAMLKHKKQRTRRFKVRPINRARRARGTFHYYKKMKMWDPQQFFKFTRMTVPIFEELLQKVKPHIQRAPRKDGVNAEERLVLTLQ